MSRMFPSCLNLLVIGFLFPSTESHSGQVLPPQNLSLVWRDDFNAELTWHPPQQALSGCKYRVQSDTNDSSERTTVDSPPWTKYIVMEGGYLQLTVLTICNGNASEGVVLTHTYPELVKEVECYIVSSKHCKCSWEAGSRVHDLSFFYRLVKDDFTVSVSDNSSSPLQECPSYIYDGDNRTGCDLEATIDHSIDILFNRTVNDSLFRNTFKKHLSGKVKPPPLNWTVTKVGGKFNISWIPIDIKLPWEYLINYTECNKSKEKRAGRGISYQLDLVPHCQYSMQIRAQYDNHYTPWSEVKKFEPDTDSNAVVFAAIIIPLVFAGLVILTFVCCRKNKDHIFPKVPQPRDFLSDIYDNNNKSTIRDLYIPAEEEENCNITLVMDPQNEYKPDY